jgi:hypothetical protein
VKEFLTIAGAEYVVHYDYKITSPGAPEQGPSYSSGGQPAEPFEFEVTLTDLCKDEGGGEETSVEVPAWLKEEIENWLFEDPDGKVYAAIEEDAANNYEDELDAYSQQDADR